MGIYMHACVCVMYGKINAYSFSSHSFRSPYCSTQRDMISACVFLCVWMCGFQGGGFAKFWGGWERLAQDTTLSDSLDILSMKSFKGSRLDYLRGGRASILCVWGFQRSVELCLFSGREGVLGGFSTDTQVNWRLKFDWWRYLKPTQTLRLGVNRSLNSEGGVHDYENLVICTGALRVEVKVNERYDQIPR